MFKMTDLEKVAISAIREVLTKIPTQKELSEYSKVQAKRYNFCIVTFKRLVETQICFELEIGKRI